MDLDISDILADVSRPLQNQSSSSLSQQQQTLDASTSLSDHQLLVRAWTAERCSPSLLPYPLTLIDRTMQRVRDQITRIEDMTATVPDPYAVTNTSTTGTTSTGANTNLVLSILQTDLGRTQFIVRSYLRQRLSKLTRHAMYYAQQHAAAATTTDNNNKNTTTKDPLLSPAEVSFVQHHQALLSRFYDDSFLAAFPANLRRLDDRAGGVDMVEGPDWGGAVVVRCLSDVWSNDDLVSRPGTDSGDRDGHQPTTELRMRNGEVWVVRWRDTRPGVVKGDLELL